MEGKDMRKINFLIFFLAIGIMTLSSNICASEEIVYKGEPISLRFSTMMPPTHMIYKHGMLKWFEMLGKESKGKLTVNAFTSSTLNGPKEGFTACKNNICDWATGYIIYHPKSFDLNHVLGLPFAFQNAYVSSLVAEELYPKYFKKEYEKMGVYLANYHTTAPYNLFSTKPIRTLEDLKRTKVRSAGGSSTDLIKLLGATPVLIPSSETYEAFRRGIVDAVLFYDAGCVSYRIQEVAKYRTEVFLNITPTDYCLNPKTFDRLPSDLKKVFYSCQRRMSQMAADAFEKCDVESRDNEIKKAGIKTITLPPEEHARWRAAVEPMWDEFIKENEAKGRPGRELVKDLRRLVEKYSKWRPEEMMKRVTEQPMHGIIDGM
jgi:TRAP-type C4-dicarboxylate transport system substrate-binding protein